MGRESEADMEKGMRGEVKVASNQTTENMEKNGRNRSGNLEEGLRKKQKRKDGGSIL